MAKNNKQVTSGSKNNECNPYHHFTQVGEPNQYGKNGLIKAGKPRSPRVYCIQCGQTAELGR